MSVQLVKHLSEQITRLFDEHGATQVERYCSLDVARALVAVSKASLVESTDAIDPAEVPRE